MEADRQRRIAEEKTSERRRRAQATFPEKIKALVRIQKRNAEIAKLRGKDLRVWDVDV